MFSHKRIDHIVAIYRSLLSRAAAARGESRRHLLGIARRARKRMADIGIILKHKPDGVVYFEIKLPRAKPFDPDFAQAVKIVEFIEKEKLTHGSGIKGSPSWAICLNTHNLAPQIVDVLTRTIPALISEYAILSQRFLFAALGGDDTPYRRVALYGVPDVIRDLWRKAALRGPIFPYCFRPDLLITPSGDVVILEFNVDTRLDRGVVEGVSEYSLAFLQSERLRFVGSGLADAYARVARDRGPGDLISAATVVNRTCRTEYFAQK